MPDIMFFVIGVLVLAGLVLSRDLFRYAFNDNESFPSINAYLFLIIVLLVSIVFTLKEG